MPKYVYIQLSAQQGATAAPPLKIRADKIEAGPAGRMTLRIGNETVGDFNARAIVLGHRIAGWWIQDEED